MKPPISNELDYYAILGVAPDASSAEIKRAYRTLVKQHHPDLYALNPDVAWEAEIRMSVINKAYAVLSDSQQRQEYDERYQDWAAHRRKGNKSAADTSAARADTLTWAGFLAGSQHILKTVLQWFAVQQRTSDDPCLMSIPRKMMLAPIPFCLAIIASSLFWRLGTATGGEVVGVVSAVLAYPLILIPLVVRLILPIRYIPLMNLRKKLACTPFILASALLLGWLWLALIDRRSPAGSPLDLYWWCGLIITTCLALAYL